MTLSWIAGIVVGIVVGAVVHTIAGVGSKAPIWGTVIAGLIGAIAGRFVLASALSWHPHALGAILGAVVLSAIWAVAMRARGPAK
jgi:uncharacterized membrane protein YeaQ/YmgE (transglycosylase-associated protein family)